MEFWAIVGVVAVFVAIAMFGGYMGLRKWSRPHEFPFEGQTFIWVPDPAEDRPYGGNLYEHGSFQYADGTPVTDFAFNKVLQDHWVERIRSAESGTT